MYPKQLKTLLLVLLSIMALCPSARALDLTKAPEIKTFALDTDLTGTISNSVNMHTGDVNLPITLATLGDIGINAMYSSNIKHLATKRNLEAPTGILGLGWSTSYPMIIRNHQNTGTRKDDIFYLLTGGVSSQLICTEISGNGLTYYYDVEGKPTLSCVYYAENSNDTNGDLGHWEVLVGNGQKQVFGETSDSKQYGVRWGNWIISSAKAQSGDQQQFANAWNISSVEDQWGNGVDYEYLQVNEDVGYSLPTNYAKEHTRASYLEKISDSYGRSIKLIYGEKSGAGNVDPAGKVEYVEPHTETTELVLGDAYQEKYLTKFLDKIEIYVDEGNTLQSTIDLSYGFIGTGEYTKRILNSVVQTNSNDLSLPGISFNYNLSGDSIGMLSSVTSPAGSEIEFQYATQSISNSNRHLAITTSGSLAWGSPYIKVHDDYVVLTVRNKYTDELDLRVYTWDGRWIPKTYSLNGFEKIGGVLEYILDYEIYTEDDYFLLVNSIYSNSSTKTIYRYNKDKGNPGEWNQSIKQIEGIGNTGDSNNPIKMFHGDQYHALLDVELGKTYRWVWNGSNWIESTVAGGSTNTENSYSGTGGNNWYITHFQNGTSTDIVKLYYLSELNDGSSSSWGSSTLSTNISPTTDNGGNEPTNWTAGTSYAVAQIWGYDDRIYSWDEEYTFDATFGETASIANDAHVNTVGPAVFFVDEDDERLEGFRYNGESWVASPTRVNTSSTAFGEDYALLSGLLLDDNELINFNPNTLQWSHPDLIWSTQDVARAGRDYFIRATETKFRKPDGTWFDDTFVIPNILSTANLMSITAGTSFILFEDGTGDKDTYFYPIVNGTIVESSNEILSDKSYYQQDLDDSSPQYYQHSILTNKNNIFVTYFGSSFPGAFQFYLSFVSDGKCSGNPSDVYVEEMTIDNGGNQSISFEYIPDATKAKTDPSTFTTLYNFTKMVPNGELSENGVVEHYFYNGLPESMNSGSWPDNGSSAYTNADDYYGHLSGLEYRTIVRNSQNVEVSSEEKYHYVSSYDIEETVNDDQVAVGTYVRMTKQEVTRAGIETITENTYDDKGLLTSSKQVDDQGATLAKSEHTYFYEKYTSDNVITPVVGTKKYLGSTVVSSNATTWKEWDTDLSTDAWAPNKSFIWEGTGASGEEDFNYASYSGTTDPPSHWIKTSEINDRTDSRGGVKQVTDAAGISVLTQWDADEEFVDASFTNATGSDAALGVDASFLSFESNSEVSADNDNWDIYGTNEPSNIAHTGKYSRKLISGTEVYGPTRDFKPDDQHGKYVVSAWVRTEDGYTSNAGSLRIHTKADTAANNNTYPVVTGSSKTKSISDTDGEWVYIEEYIDLGEIRTLSGISENTPLRIRVYPKNTDASHYLLVDDLCFAPINSKFSATVRDPETLLPMAKLGVNGAVSVPIYDELDRVVSSVDGQGEVSSYSTSYLSRSGNNDVYSASDPNSSISVSARTGGEYHGFNDGSFDKWTRTGTSTFWDLSGGAIRWTPNGGWQDATATLINTPSSTYAVRLNAKRVTTGGDDGALAVRNGDIEVIWGESGGGTYRLRKVGGSTLGTVSAPEIGSDWLLLVSDNTVYFYADGEQIFAKYYTSFTPGVLKLYFQDEGSDPGSYFEVDDIIILEDPIVSVSYADGMGRPIQSQVLDGDDIIVSATLYDDLGRPAIQTKSKKLTNTRLGYDSGFAVMDWSTGKLTTGSELGIYDFSRKKYEDSPLSRVIEASIPGLGYQIGSGGTTEILYTNNTGTEDYDCPPATYGDCNVVVTTSPAPKNSKSVVVTDKLGRKIKEMGAFGTSDKITTEYEYDSEGKLETVYMPNYFDGTITASEDFHNDYTYDHFGRVKSKITPDAGRSWNFYNELGELKAVVNEAGYDDDEVLYWNYDELGRVTETGITDVHFEHDLSVIEDHIDGGGSYSSTTRWKKRYYYDEDTGASEPTVNMKGRLWKVETNSDTDAAAEVIEQFQYDAYGQVMSKKLQVLEYNSTATYTTGYEYDHMGNITEISYPDGSTDVEYAYNNLGQVQYIGVAGDADKYGAYEYNHDGSISREELDNGDLATDYTYNTQGRLFKSLSDDLWLQLSYHQDGTIEEMYLDQGSLEEYEYHYSYDNLGQLNSANDMINFETLVDRLSYDKNGNIKTIRRDGSAGTEKTYNYYAGTNKLLNTDGAGTDYTYNDLGNDNRLGKLSYDDVTQMTKRYSIDSEEYLKFEYDGANRRVLKEREYLVTEIIEGKEGKMVVTSWEDDKLLYLHGEGANVLIELSKNSEVSGEDTQIHIYGPTGLIATETAANGTHFYIKDHLGSTRQVYDSTGTIRNQYHYYPFGKIADGYSGVGDLRYQYTGQEKDSEIGLMNYKARMYDPNIGRFLSKDPAEEFPSPYLYAANNPLYFTDPTGESVWSWARTLGYSAVGITVGVVTTFIPGVPTVGWVYIEDDPGNKTIVGLGYGPNGYGFVQASQEADSDSWSWYASVSFEFEIFDNSNSEDPTLDESNYEGINQSTRHQLTQAADDHYDEVGQELVDFTHGPGVFRTDYSGKPDHAPGRPDFYDDWYYCEDYVKDFKNRVPNFNGYKLFYWPVRKVHHRPSNTYHDSDHYGILIGSMFGNDYYLNKVGVAYPIEVSRSDYLYNLYGNPGPRQIPWWWLGP